MKFLSIAVPALLLATAPAFAQDAGGKSDSSIAAPTGGIQGAQTGAGHMNGPMGNGQASMSSDSSMSSGSSASVSSPSSSSNMASNSSMSSGAGLSIDSAPTYQGGRAAYRGKSRSSLDKSEAQITADLNQQVANQ